MSAFTYRLLLLLFGFAFGISLPLCGQKHDETAPFREVWTTWEDFVEEFLHRYTDEEEEDALSLRAQQSESLSLLEELRTHPLNLNTAQREELLELVWLSEEQVDSLLHYRQRIGAFSSLGDLMAVPRWEHRDRKWVSLFAYVGDTLVAPPRWYAPLTEGRHSVEWAGSAPLYLRDGFRPYDEEGQPRARHNLYLGPPMAHTLRYRHQWQKRIKWGATLQNDSGEPFAQRGNLPFDYNSAYFAWSNRPGTLQMWLGDYHVQLGQGLLMGHAFLLSPLQHLLSPQLSWSRVSAHTSSEETRFLRGAALRLRKGKWLWSGFASHRWRDGRTEGDTLRSWLTTGLHRSRTELNRRGTVGTFTLGGNAQYLDREWRWGASLFAEHYDHLVFPTPRPYNRHYLRGHWAGGASIDYGWRRGAWSVQGEMATDAHLHWATTHSAQWAFSSATTAMGQLRWFAPKYVAPRAQALAQSSHVQNELALVLALSHQWAGGLKMRGFIEMFRFEQPTFRADTTSHGLETSLEAEWERNEHTSHLLRYRLRTRQQNIPRYAPLLEYRSTHGLRYQWRIATRQYAWQVAADMSLHHRQTRPSLSWGGMLSTRVSWQSSPRWRIAAFAAIFHTADYDTRLYAYQPQLQHSGAFPAFAHSGTSGVLQSIWKWGKSWEVGLRASLYHYFKTQEIGSGMQRIAQPTQVDVSWQLRWHF